MALTPEEKKKQQESDLIGCVQLLNELFKRAETKDGKVTFTTTEETWGIYKKFVSEIELPHQP